MVNICVNGSRTFTDYKLLDSVLRRYIPLGSEKNYKLILGGARGADRLAESWAIKNKVSFEVYLADWKEFGNRAGALRNIEMLKVSKALISFWDGQSKGTKQAIEYAKQNNIPYKICYFLDTIPN